MRDRVAVCIFTAFLLGNITTYFIFDSLGITWKSSLLDKKSSNFLYVPRFPDNSSSLKNEIALLTKEKLRLKKLLSDLRETVTQQNSTQDHERFVEFLKTNISKLTDVPTLRGDSHRHYDDTTVADHLYNKTRVLCWVMTQPGNLETRAIHIKRTWGRRCNKLLFFSSVGNDDFPVIGLGTKEGREFLTMKCSRAFRYVYKHYFNDFDWFMRTDDDSYVIMENLRYFLSGQDTNKPVFFGHKFKAIVPTGYFAGGPGIVLSREALHRFSTKGSHLCPEDSKMIDDVYLGFCMHSLGVTAGDSLDSEGRSRFHCFEPVYHVMGSYPNWFYQYDANGAKSGISSISDYAIGFHYVSPSIIYLLEYFIYHLRPYGIQFIEQDINKPAT